MPREYTFLPNTYVLPEDREQLERKEFDGTSGRPKVKGRYFIVTPDSQCKGRGIQIVNNFEAIEKIIYDNAVS